MNKPQKIVLVFLTALMTVFLYLKPIYAKSGCCSHHGGVNCAAGPQSNGKVICNDGWTESSCYYSEMVKCGGYTAPEPEPQIEAPAPTIVVPPEPKPSPSPSPRPSFSPSPTPSVLPKSTSPTKPQLENKPTSKPEVKGYETKTKSEPLSATDWAIFLFLLAFVISVLGLFGLGSYKLLLRIRKIFRRKNDF